MRRKASGHQDNMSVKRRLREMEFTAMTFHVRRLDLKPSHLLTRTEQQMM